MTTHTCWRSANSLLTDRQQLLDLPYAHVEVQPPRPRPAARPDPRHGQRAVRGAGLRRGLGRGHRQRGRRHPRPRAPLLRRAQGRLHRAAGAHRRQARGRAPATDGSQRSRACRRQRLALAGLDRGQPHDLAGHDGARRGDRRPRGPARRRGPRRPRRRAARGLSRRHRRGLAAASLRTRMLDRPQPLRDAALAGGRGHPRGHTGVAHLHARARPAHLRRATQGT